MRGKPLPHDLERKEARNIPAYAGKTEICGYRDAEGKEHPRVCGENAWAEMGVGMVTGTSPRMRGKHHEH